MGKRLSDTNKFKKSFIRSLPGAYKLLWDFLCNDCDHAGIWIVDFPVAQLYLGEDMPVTKVDAIKYFNQDEVRIIEFDGGKKWFLPSFIQFQYGELNVKNRVHASVISILKKNNLLENKPLISPLHGAKDKDIDKDKDIGGAGGEIQTDEPAAPKQIKLDSWNTKPTPSDIPDLPKPNIQAAIENIYHTKNITFTPEKVNALFRSFLVVNTNGVKFYNNVEEVYSHFHNSLKYEKFDKINDTGKNKGSSPLPGKPIINA